MKHTITLVLLFLLLVVISFKVVKHHATKEDVSFVVAKTERVMARMGNKSKYLVFTEGETFENTDTLWSMKWNSSDMYGEMKPGMWCEATVTGWRVPFMSWYRNILSANCNVRM